jgi:SAM-dependent methyltransferase
MNDWHEDDEFWTTAIGPLFNEQAWLDAAGQAEQLMNLLELKPPARILDLGCGPGRFCIPLARLGLRMTGVDRTRPFLAEAERRAADAGVEVELIEADMREFTRPGGFDAAISMMTSFGYFEAPADDRRVVENVYGALASWPASTRSVTGGSRTASSGCRNEDWSAGGRGCATAGSGSPTVNARSSGSSTACSPHPSWNV